MTQTTILQAIRTRYHGPTDRRSARITASCYGGKLTLPLDHSQTTEGNHIAAADALRRKLGWDCAMQTGSLADSDYVHTLSLR